jgi:N-acetylneuraminic acid mutarotase
MPTPRTNLTTCVAIGRIYAIGGYNLNNVPSSGTATLSSLEEYDPLTGLWSSKTAMPYPPLQSMASGAINDRIYLTGGLFIGASNSTWEYDPAGDTWKGKTAMPTALVSSATAVVNNRMYIINGPITYEYTPANDLM